MKLTKKNKSLYNHSLKRQKANAQKNLNFFPLLFQISKKSSQHSKLIKEEISLGIQNINKNMSNNNKTNKNNNKNQNHSLSNSSLLINFLSPVHNKNFFKNKKNKSNVQSIMNDSQQNNNIVLTSVDNNSVAGSKEKILSYNQNKIRTKNINNKKYPKTALNSRKNSVDEKRNKKSIFQKCQKIYNKNSVNINSNRNKIFQNVNVKTYSNKNLLNSKNNNSNIKIVESNFNNYINNSKLQKNLNNKKNRIKNLTHFLYNTNNNIIKNNNFTHIKKNVSITHTTKVSPAVSFINNNSKSLKSINTLKNKSKISDIIKNVINDNNKNINLDNNKIKEENNNNSNKNNQKKKNINYNSFNNFYNIINNNNNSNNNNYINNNNIENIINNCQTTSCGAFYNNYNININNLINNHIIYNNNINNLNNINSRKKLNFANLGANKKINRIISQSQQEIIQIKKESKKHFTSNNSPNRNFNFKITSSTKKINNKNNLINQKNFFLVYNNKNINSNIKILNALRNNAEKKNTKKIKSKSTEKLNMQINNLKEELNLEPKNNNLIKVNNKLNSFDLLNQRKSKSSQKEFKNQENISKNIYMESSLNLTNYILKYYKKNKKYPNTNLSFYKYGRLIGQGAFGKVNLGLNVLSGRVVAIKSFNKKNFDMNSDFIKKIIYETNLMKKLNHKNVTKILEMFEDDKYILIIMEYINGGNLFSFVKKRRKLSEKISKFLFKQIILGLQHIHSHNIVHRDVKLENILIDLNNTIKICDFGIGRVLSNPNDDLLYDQCGTPMYMAPEILFSSKEKGYKGFPIDIWSAGIALYIMLSGTLPFSVKKEDSLLDFDNNNKNKKKNLALKQAIMFSEPKKIEKISSNAKNLLHGLLNKDPNKRLTIEQILNHPWLKEDENDLNNSKMHLFTKAEIIMLSKTYIDYRKANMDELQENFTISNLKIDKDIKTLKNITTKSFILTPYNSILEEDENNSYIEINNEFDDINNSKIKLENELISLENKVKEYNMLYELNNNKEVDNGMLKNSKIHTNTNSLIINDLNENSQVKTESVIFEGDGIIHEDKKILIKKKKEIDEIKKEEKILEKIEEMGYDKIYIKKCLDDNVLCQATAIYFLLMNYENIK